MKKKNNNNLIALIYEDGDRLYYTSMTRAGLKVGLTSASIKWAIDHKNEMEDWNGRKLRTEIVDGSEVPYKFINN